MFDPTAIPLAELLGPFSSMAGVILVAAIGLILLELAIVLGAVIANFGRRDHRENGGEVGVP